MKCNTCNQEKEGCATLYLSSGTFYILGCYGSYLYDMQRYALKRDKYQTGDICDDCITELIRNGNAQLIEDGVW